MKRTDITNLFPEATDEQISQLMNIHGADLNALREQIKTRDATITELQTTASANETAASDLQAALEKAQGLQNELDSLKAADALRVMREKVATEMKIPARMLTMQTEEECREQAQSILDFAKYPKVPDGGEPTGTPKPSTREQFAEWFEQISS